MKANRAILVLLLCGFAASVASALADESIALSNTPAAVQKTIQSQVVDGKIGGIFKRAEDLDTVFDVELTAKDGFERDFTVAQDGTLLSVEVTLAEIPAEVRQTIKSELNGSGPDSIDKNVDDADVSYDVEGPGNDGKPIDFTVDEDGTLISRQVALTDTPQAAQKTIADQLGGGKISTIDENFDDDGTNFDVTVTESDGSESGFNVATDGTLVSKEVSLDEVPARARATVKNHIGDGTILRVDRSFEKRDNALPFEVEGRKDGKPFDFSVAPRGRFLGMDD
ncbi:MAG TPA: hypothetical protein VH280_01115 [Verrucomicrobiae bacterium]|jgi:uncharacterized membrane protein YkoI|nr:hypothetical protein [Verrucomicrobiae bacterium]